VGLFPNEASILRLIGAVLMVQNEEWQLQPRCMPQHTMTEVTGESPQDGPTASPIAA
jgi:putative transposase